MLELDVQSDSPDIVIGLKPFLAAAVKTLRNQFARSLGSPLRPAGASTHIHPARCPQPLSLELLHGLYVLEYENDDLWYDLHPLVTDLLRRKNLLPDAA